MESGEMKLRKGESCLPPFYFYFKKKKKNLKKSKGKSWKAKF